MSNKDLFKDYKPEIINYDETVDGGDEHKIRENRLDEKKELLEKMKKAKAKAKGNKTTFRQNIRSENLN